ncbi:MAG TPA: AAA family ATPase [Xanthobacteraceae bacterium]|nr:AAA family ATPase [Xanthobacteraceae bacterium]
MDETSESQAAVLSFLGSRSTHGGQEVRRIHTHAAAVFLAGDRAYKIKRAVRFPFLDYSTLEKRRIACLSELEVNHRYAPELYRRVVPITRQANGSLALGGDGEPVEWVIEMVRFDDNRTLDRVAENEGISDTLAERLGRAVAEMQKQAPVVDAERWLAALAEFVDQNTDAFRAAPSLFTPDAVTKLDQAARAALAKLRPLLLSRGRSGLVRRGHGDLHLGNIVLLDDRPVPFDAIEFDPLIAAGDVLYELAFLLMDLVERRLERAANIVFNRYFVESFRPEDFEGLAALPFFMSLRAAIRAKVTLARAPHVEAAARASVQRAAQAYFALALDLLSPPPAALIAIAGLSGTGKSVLARDLAPSIGPHPGALVLRSDIERKRLFGIAETERLPAAAYQPEVTIRVYRTLSQHAGRVVAAGHAAIVDAVFAKAEERAAIAAVAKAAHVGFHGLFLVADLQTRLQRVVGRTRDASDADAEVVRQQERYAVEPIEWTKIDASGAPEETLARARDAMQKSSR